MKETMYDCYLSQFNCMAGILAGREHILRPFVDFYVEAKPSRIYLLGSGTSFNAAIASAPMMESVLGVEVTPIAPSAMGRLYGQHPVVIAISQSGRSTNTIKAIEELKAAGIAVITLTDPSDTPVGNTGDLPIQLAAENELIGPRTRGYTATVLTLQLMALEAGLAQGIITQNYYDEVIGVYQSIIENGDEYFSICRQFYDSNFEKLSRARKYIFAGKAEAASVSKECALKVLETVCYPAIGYEYEEFLHGPVCFADPELAVFLYLSHDEDRIRMLSTAKLLDNITDSCFIVTHGGGINGIKNGNLLLLPGKIPEYAEIFTYILIGQLISAKLTEDLKRERYPGVQAIFDQMGTKTSINTAKGRR